MQENIYFRGIDIFTDDWVYGYPVPDGDIKDRWYIVSPISGFLDKTIVKKETISQYSGMKDMKNRKIFAGDILTCKNAFDEEITVICKFGCADRILHVPENASYNECSIYGFYFEVNGKATYPIINNYQGKHDLEILKIINNIYTN